MRFTAKAILTAILAGIVCTCSFAAGSFEKKAVYTEGTFADIPADVWYAKEVKNTYELGLMNGKGDGVFEPSGNVTIAEAITMASRAASIYAGEEIHTVPGEWYNMYVEYAKAKGFVKDGQFDDFTRPAKRYEVAALFENAMPEGYYNVVNAVKSIPDVSETESYADDLLTLYNAGIVMGSDEYGTFNPNNNITRAEAAAIINRVALPENRLSKTLKTVQDKGAYVLARNENYSLGARAGIRSGWILDNTGGAPRKDVTSYYETINDISPDAGVALIREFNKITEGRLVLKTKVTAGEAVDGIYIDYRNENGDTVYRLEIKDKKWCVVLEDGSYKEVYSIEDETVFHFNIVVDLYKGTSTTNINYKDCGTYNLVVNGDAANILTFRFATTDECMASFMPGAFEIVVNYGVNEEFTHVKNSSLPVYWEGTEGVRVSSGELLVSAGGNASNRFDTVTGKIISEFNFYAPDNRKLSTILSGDGKTIAKFVNDGKDLYVNGVKVYENVVSSVSYVLRLEADTETQTILVKLNGMKKITVPFAETTAFADMISFVNDCDKEIAIDNVYVYEYVEAADYVPVPVKPQGEEKYNVGINVCSIWQSDEHHGWNVNSPYDDRLPVLGYYDEAVSETADWEIKYMVEHGIDFQAFCWYTGNANGAIKQQYHMANDHMNAFKNAKYSDMMQYCIIWEAGTHAACESKEAWEKHFVPYWIEHFFKDDRYVRIDNKAILAIFGFSNVVKAFGGEEATKERFDYLREEVKKLGYDDIIILSSHASNSASLKNSGLDGGIAYNWGNSGYSLDVNKTSILNNQNKGFVYTVPTISVGFNSIPWWGERYPMMSMDDFRNAQKWVKEEYLPTYAKEEWQKNLVWISTWNEYGEGTFIMPTTDEKGFGYVDILREEYTDENADASINNVPTPSQKERINHRYPQYRRLLRRDGYVQDEISSNFDNYELIYKIDYATENNIKTSQINDMVQDENGLSGLSGSDAIVWVNSYTKNIDLSLVDIIRIKIKAPKGTILSLFHTTSLDKTWNEEKRKNITHTTSEMTDVIIKVSDLKKTNGVLTGFRIDPVNTSGNKFTLVSAEFLSGRHLMSKDIVINGITHTQYFTPKQSANGEWLVAFDPNTGIDFGLGCFHIWNRDKKELTLNFKNHTVVYTVGKDTYLFNGETRNLGFVLEELDNIPLIPIEKLCNEVGYNFSVFNGNQIMIITDNYEFYEKEQVAKSVAGNWDFNIIGSTEGWRSGNMALASNGSTLNMSTCTTSQNVQILLGNLQLLAEKYESLEFKCRYKFTPAVAGQPSESVMYFLTDRDGTWNEAKTVRTTLKSSDSNGNWETYIIDLSECAEWNNTITELRFDPFNGLGAIELDYMRFNVDPNYVYIDPDTLPMTVKNPDAEEEELAFHGGDHKTKVSIITDPDNANNKCYAATSALAGQRVFCSMEQEVRYTAGAKYIIEFDAKMYSYDGSTELPNGLTGQILVNARYDSPAGLDHLAKNRFKLSAGDSWQHCEVEFTVDAESVSRSGDVLRFYTDPIDNLGVGFAVDNIKVTEVKPNK